MATFTINGSSRTFDGDPNMPLLWYLRDELGHRHEIRLWRRLLRRLHGARGRAGRPLVHDDDEPLGGKKVVTIEASAPAEHPVQQAWIAANVAQCGYCQTGQIMQAAALLATKPRRPTPTSTRRWPATSAGAARISASARPSRARRESGHERPGFD